MTTTIAPAKTASARDIARARASGLLGIAPKDVEDDLLDFITHTQGDALLRARAGSGKTTALALKAAYLTLDRGVRPDSIAMLAFNNAAARSLESRLAAFKVPAGIRVRTFHALAQRIVRAHFGGARRPVFDEKSEDGKLIQQLMEESVDEVVNDRFYHFCASKMRTKYEKRVEYVESVGRDALVSATNFLRARGYGLQNRMANAWDIGGPIAGNAMKVIMSYETKLKDARLLDATAVLQAASWTLEREIETGAHRPSEAHDLDWIFIDEFQDVSLPYMRLVSAIRRINGMLNIQGVGDDWQAVNGFAGADLTYFEHVTKHLEDPCMLTLLRNRRSGSSIVEWGNSVMAAAGYPDAPAIPDPQNGEGVIKQGRLSASGDIRFAAQKLAERVDPSMKSVALIARKWKAGDHSLYALRKAMDKALKEAGYKGTLVAITAHGSKGLEYDQVFLLDDGSFPIEHPSRPILEYLIPEDEFLREESCLKHVAGTRAKKRLDIITLS